MNIFDNRHSETAMHKNALFLRNNNKYFQWNLSVFPVRKNSQILDLGCGPGIYYHEIMRYEPSLYYATDYSDKFLEETRKLFIGNPNCIAGKIDLLDNKTFDPLYGYKFDHVLCFDVLEHIEDDRQALININGILRNTGCGKLFLRVPALQAIYGENDRAIGHYRRYLLKELRSLLEETSFEVETIQYQNFIGVIPWYLIGNIFKRSLAVSGTEGSIFNLLVPVIKFIENLFPPPVGLSLYCVCSAKEGR